MTPAEFLQSVQSRGPYTDGEARGLRDLAESHLIHLDFARHGPRGCPDDHVYLRSASRGEYRGTWACGAPRLVHVGGYEFA